MLVKLLLALLLCAPAQAAVLGDLELLRGLAADQGVPVMDLAQAPKAHAAPATKDFEGLGTVVAKSSWWQRPKEALKDRSFLPDGSKNALWLKDGPAAGSRAWVKGEVHNGVLHVSDAVVFPAKNAKDLPSKAGDAVFAAELVQVSPWCDHMPTFAARARRQYLVVETKLTNKTDKPLEVSLSRVFFSFDKASEGARIDGLSIRGADGRASGVAKTVLPPGATLKLELRGDGLYPEGSEGKTLFVILRLSAGPDTLFVRGGGQVIATQ